MAEYIKRQEALGSIEAYMRRNPGYTSDVLLGFLRSREAIAFIPAEKNIEKVVRCKDCAYMYESKLEHNKGAVCECGRNGIRVFPHSFCSFGKKDNK